jgi:predicted O-linked N-acetylglucosamine transferase (SPINDLY family)
MPTIPQLLADALEHHHAGRFQEAEQGYREILQLDHNDVNALHLLGVLYQTRGNNEMAVHYIGEALRRKADFPEAHNNLGNALRELGRLEEAVASYRQALLLRPDYALAYNNLGIALSEQGRAEEAVASYRGALRLKPDNAEAHNNLGVALKNQGSFDEAVACFQRALRIKPYYPEAHDNLGNALKEQGKLEDAVASHQQALRLKPDLAEAHSNLGNAFQKQGRLDEAVASYQQALRLKPNFAEACSNLGNALQEQGRLEEAINYVQRARELKPGDQKFHSALLGSLHYDPRFDRLAILQELRRWGLQFARPLAAGAHSFGNDPSPERRLRIGYVSPDFRDHVVARNIWPLLRNHDPEQFEITLYANLSRADAMTEQFRSCAHGWCPIAGWPDERVAERIRQDGIDILVDLALHTLGNRLLVFARKPAPVQVTFAGYPGSTGLRAIDYRLTDPYLDPPGQYDEWYAEQSYRLPHSFWCYDPQTQEPAVAPLPALQRGLVTFGCLNNFCKVNDGVLELWAQVLRDVPGSRLLLLAKQGSHRERTVDLFAQKGIAPERIEFFSFKPRPEYLALYHQVDIGLDTSPYNGHTTSLDSFWMGVPVITLVGNTVVGRAGLSQLSNLGLAELAASTSEGFVGLAVDLAADLPRLAALRYGLRDRMRQSPLMDAAGFARDIEHAYRVMWRNWCAQPHPGHD